MTSDEARGTLPPLTTDGDPDASCEQPWSDLKTAQDVEAWISGYDTELQRCIKSTGATGHGVCFSLRHGGQVFMGTAEGTILLDVTPEAAWAAPVIAAATGTEAPPGQIWMLPDDQLTQLVLGLSSLIASTRMVASHRYKAKQY